MTSLFLLLSLCLLTFTPTEAQPKPTSKSKPKPKPTPGKGKGKGNGNGNDDDNMYNMTDDVDPGPICPEVSGEGYCGANNLIGGEQCGNYGIFDYSYCGADTAGTPHCFAFVWCDSVVKNCTCTSECGEFEACLLSCWPYPVCTPVCGNPNMPLMPSFNDAPYYDLNTPSDTCLNETDTGLSVDIALRDIHFERDSTYSTYMKRLQATSTPETSLMTPLNIILASVAILMLILVSLRQIRSTPQPRFTALPTSSEHLGDLELEEKVSSKSEPVSL